MSVPVALICPCWRLAVFFGGFIWDRFALCLLAAPLCLIRLAITRHASRDVIVPIAPLIVSPYGFPSPLAPFLDTPGGEGCLLGLAVPFMSARRDIIRPRYSSNRSSPRLLTAHRPIPINTWGVSVYRLLTAVDGCCDSYRLSYQSAHPFRSHPPRPIDTGNGENGGANCSRAWCGHPVCLPLRLRRGVGRRRLRLSYGCFELLARYLAIVGQYSGGLCGSSWGRVSVGFDYFPACFVSPAVSYPFTNCSSPLPRAVSSIPFLCLLHPHRSAAASRSPHPLLGDAPCGFPPLPLIVHHAPPARIGERGGFSKGIEFDAFKIVAVERSLPAVCLPSDGFNAARRLISSSRRIRLALLAHRRPIPSRCRLADGVAAPIAPRFTPRPACRRTGRRCLDVIGCHAVDTVVCDSDGGIRPIEPTLCHLIISSSHPLSLIAHPPLPGSLLPACFKQSPAPGRGRRQRNSGLRLRVLRRFACFPLCRAAHSLTLVRYCRRPVIGRLAIVAPMSSPLFPSARLFRHRPRYPSSRYPRRRRHHTCGLYPPRLSPRPTCRGTGRGYGLAA